MENVASFDTNSNAGLQVDQNSGNINYFAPNSPKDRALAFIRNLSNGYRRQKDVNPVREPNTCRWFLADERFRAWREGCDARLLHVYAGPGCGKSVLAKALIDDNLVANERTATTLYFFFRSGQRESDHASSAIAALIHQLYIQYPDATLSVLMRERYDAHGPRLAQLYDELWDALLETCELLEGNITCILDAMDECCEEDCEALITKISAFYSSIQANSVNFKLLITSRPYREIDFDIEPSGERTAFIRLDGDDKSDIIAEEIKQVIKPKIKKAMPRISEQVRDAIVLHLQSMNNRNYLWLDLMLDYVKKKLAGQGTEAKLKKLFDEIPPTVDKVYEEMLNRSPNHGLTRKLLSITLSADRPMTLSEIKFAVELAGNSFDTISEVKKAIEPDDTFKYSLRDLCGLLLAIHDKKVYFFHQTVREYLLRESSLPGNRSVGWKHSISIKGAHFNLAKICLQFLSFPDLDPFPFSWRFEVLQKRAPMTSEVNTWFEDQGLLLYAAKKWPTHYLKSDERAREELVSWAPKLFNKIGRQDCSWIRAYTFDGDWVDAPNPSTLMFLAENGLESFIERHLAARKVFRLTNVIDSLCVAVAPGYGNIVHRLLEYLVAAEIHQDAQVSNMHQSLASRALPSAVTFGHQDIFRMIIDYLRVNGYNHSLNSQTLIAISKTNDDANLQRVLEFPAGVDMTMNVLVNCLHGAASRPSAIKLILDNRLRDSELSQITWNRLVEVLAENLTLDGTRMLLDHYPTFSLGTWQTIMNAGYRMHKPDMVEFLLKHYATLFDPITYGNILHEVASSGDEDILRLLLRFHHADIDSKKRIFQKAFNSAAAKRQDRMLQMLLSDARLGKYSGIGPALYTAGVEGRLDLARSLLTYASQVGIALTDDLYLALESAATYGNKAMVELLLRDCSQGPGSIPEHCYRAALNNATRNSHDPVVQSLLDQGPEDLSRRYAHFLRDAPGGEGDGLHETSWSSSEEDLDLEVSDVDNSS